MPRVTTLEDRPLPPFVVSEKTRDRPGHHGASQSLERIPLSWLRLLAPRPLVSLLYHLCSDRGLPHVDPLFSYKTPDEFEQDLIYLRRHFTPVTHEQVYAHAEGRSKLPARACELSFDDGLAECGEAGTLLRKYDIPATFFIVTSVMDNKAMMFRHRISLCLDRLDGLPELDLPPVVEELRRAYGLSALSRAEVASWVNGLEFEDSTRIDSVCDLLGIDIASYLSERRPYLTTEDVLQLHRDGFTIGAHSCNHPRLERVADWKDARREILDSCAAIRDLTGQRKVPFAIPFNGLAIDRASIQELLDTSGFISLVYDTNDLMRDHRRIVNRVSVDTPVGAQEGRSNLGFLIARAYALEPWRSLRRRRRPN